jgi:hypothetical protein
MADLATCHLPVIIEKMREISDRANKENDFLRALLFGSLATRFQNAHDEIEELSVAIYEAPCKYHIRPGPRTAETAVQCKFDRNGELRTCDCWKLPVLEQYERKRKEEKS